MSGVRRRAAGGAALGLAVSPPSAWAGHSYTELYNPFYMVGIVLVIIVSLALAVAAAGRATRPGGGTDVRGRVPAGGRAGLRVAVTGLRILAVGAFALVVAAALMGSRLEAWNIAPTAIWLGAWLLIPALQILVGDVWSIVNPWRAVFGWLRPSASPRRAYPRWAAAWPAVILFAGVLGLRGLWAELGDPRVLGILALVYSAVTWTGMALFGARVWLERGECFTVFYELLAAMGPLERTVIAGEASASRTEIRLRPWALGLLARPTPGLDLTAFVLLMLGGGMFGGILDTRWWESVRVALGFGAERFWALDALALAAFMALTGGVYGTASLLTSLGAPGWSTLAVARTFALSLVPLAAGFHLMHGFDHALESVQLLSRLVSDPFGFGWDLFGTRAMPFARPNPWLVWSVQLVTIVAAHVAGIWVAHMTAVRTFTGRGRLLVYRQAPMVAVMVLFTVSGLWVLSRIPMMM